MCKKNKISTGIVHHIILIKPKCCCTLIQTQSKISNLQESSICYRSTYKKVVHVMFKISIIKNGVITDICSCFFLNTPYTNFKYLAADFTHIALATRASPIAFTVWQTSFSGTGRNEELDHRKASDQGSFPVLDIFTSALSTPAI